MAKKREKSDTQPRFAYTTSPASLRRVLTEIPKRPKPGKLTLETMKTWKATASNDASPLAVLKKIGLLSSNGEPQSSYLEFMQTPPVGPRALGAKIREHYRDLFETSHEPHKNPGDLKTFFNIHGGGGARVNDFQVQTFKALSEHADFSGIDQLPNGAAPGAGAMAAPIGGPAGSLPPVQIALHIHLPENKTTRDYESIIQDIAKYIYGRSGVDRG